MKRYLLMLLLSLSAVFPSYSQDLDGVDQDHRLLISRFVDAYRQSYENRDIRFIRHVFSEDALIITQTLELVKGPGSVRFGDKGRKYKLNVENKKQYIRRLEQIFSTSETLRLNISGLTVVRHRVHDSVYGVTFRQLWQGDGEGAFKDERNREGFIFLMIDFTLSDLTPAIQIRTWQPEKAAEEEGVFSLYDFEIVV